MLPPRQREAPEDQDEDEAAEDSDDDEEEGSDQDSEEEGEDDQGGSDDESGMDDASDESGDEENEAAELLEGMVAAGRQDEGRKRKRKQRDEYDNLESKYLNRLADEEEPSGKRLKGGETESADDDAPSAEDDLSDNEAPVHESLAADSAATELEKANRTVFLSNVSSEAITSRKAKKTLLVHLSSELDKKASPPQKIESIRFRSTAFSTAAIPKRAAYIKKSVMEATTKSTNAYVVYNSAAAARLAVQRLNGTMVLDRHLRADSVAHPAPVDHRRCVFVGNLGFVDDESLLNIKVDEEGKEVTEKKKRTRVPMDVEEGLWRVFGKEAGKVESIRVIRDSATRVGKGIAYVQFYVSSISPLRPSNRQS